MNFTEVTGLTDINESDKVYVSDDGQHVKARVLRLPVPAEAGPEQQRNCIVLKVSASLCDEQGKALPDTELGWQIAPAHTYTINVQAEIAAGRTMAELAEQYRIEQCEQALAYKAVLIEKDQFVLAQE